MFVLSILRTQGFTVYKITLDLSVFSKQKLKVGTYDHIINHSAIFLSISILTHDIACFELWDVVGPGKMIGALRAFLLNRVVLLKRLQ